MLRNCHHTNVSFNSVYSTLALISKGKLQELYIPRESQGHAVKGTSTVMLLWELELVIYRFSVIKSLTN